MLFLRVTSNMLICFWKRFPRINCYAFDIQINTRHPMRCNNRDDLLHLSFTSDIYDGAFIAKIVIGFYCNVRYKSTLNQGKINKQMLAWVLNTPLLFEDSSKFYFFKVFYVVRLLKSVISLQYFPSFNSSNMLLNI